MKRWLIVAVILLTLGISAFVFMQSMAEHPLVRLGVPGQWVWRYDHSPYFDRAMFSLAGAVLLGWLCHTTRNRVSELRRGSQAVFLLAAVVVCFWMQGSFAYLSRSGFGEGVFWMAMPKANIDFAEASKGKPVAQLLQEAQDPNRRFRIHLSTHPPGPVLFYLMQKRLWENSPDAAAGFAAQVERNLPYAYEARRDVESHVLSRPFTGVELAVMYGSILLLWLVVALGIIPFYFWATDVFGPQTAVMATGLYALTPSYLLFNPMTDLLYVPLGISILAAIHLGLVRHDPVRLVLAGILTWLALQFTVAFVVVPFIVALYLGLEARFPYLPRDRFNLLLWYAFAFLFPILVCWCLPARYNCFLVWKLCSANNAAFNASRTYWAWLGYDPIDFVMFIGLPVATFLVAGVVHAVRHWTNSASWRYTVAFAGTLILLEVSGINRGEVARLWMFLMPIAAAIAAHAMREADGKGKWVFLTCFSLQFVQSILFKLSLDTILPSAG